MALNAYLKYFEYHRMWGRIDVCWQNIREDVNILVGNNGSGKTTFLNAIYDYYTKAKNGDRSPRKGTALPDIAATSLDLPIAFVKSFDVPSNVKRNTISPLQEELRKAVYQNSERLSFFDYRMRALNYKEQAQIVEARVQEFFACVDDFFASTSKHIAVNPETNKLVFLDKNSQLQINLEMLSAGEKQLLLILLTVFLMDKQPYLLLMDEPELSLHVEWQEKLIAAVRRLNENCQLIVTTHSPNIFMKGWEPYLTFIEDLYR